MLFLPLMADIIWKWIYLFILQYWWRLWSKFNLRHNILTIVDANNSLFIFICFLLLQLRWLASVAYDVIRKLVFHYVLINVNILLMIAYVYAIITYYGIIIEFGLIYVVEVNMVINIINRSITVIVIINAWYIFFDVFMTFTSVSLITTIFTRNY